MKNPSQIPSAWQFLVDHRKDVWIWVTGALSFLILAFMGLHFEIQGAVRTPSTSIALEKVEAISQNRLDARRFQVPGTRPE